jgi:hypothetical protein
LRHCWPILRHADQSHFGFGVWITLTLVTILVVVGMAATHRNTIARIAFTRLAARAEGERKNKSLIIALFS